MNVTDRSILRIAVYEILFMDTPKPVVISEAVELAKKFGTDQSAAFINGILDKVVESR
jgi:N utilization substance protein B